LPTKSTSICSNSICYIALTAEFDSCNKAYTFDRTGTHSPSEFIVPNDTPDGTVLYFISNYLTQCAEGTKVAVTINGGHGGTSGQCIATACRVTSPQSSVGDDGQKIPEVSRRCCDVPEGLVDGYKPFCEDGYTYHRWDQVADNGIGDGEECDAPMAGTCCVINGGTVPQGASLPSNGNDGVDGDDDGAASGLKLSVVVVATSLIFATVM